MNLLPKKKILGVEVTDASIKDVLEYLNSTLDNRREKYCIVTPNPEIVTYANKHKEFLDIINHARIALCDGIGLQIASLVLGKLISQRITGTDFVKIYCENVSKKHVSIGFLGAQGNIAELTAECLLRQYSGLRVVYAAAEWGDEGWMNAEKLSSLVSHTHQEKSKHDTSRHIDMLFVAYGFPKQEQWMADNIDKLDVSIMMGVGGAFDYISGKVTRAPFLIRFVGLEWLYRLLRQPWRIRRQLALLQFIWLVIKARILNSS